ncbi:hypothetical protein H0H93_011347 [Arthromyces matolae]|nr:hypothetical protein H0H93_011347 [Arthromyces matolae]
MSTTTSSTQTKAPTRGTQKRGGKGRAGSNQSRGGRSNGRVPATSSPTSPIATEVNDKGTEISHSETIANDETEEDSDVCWICAEPVKYFAVSECNHRTCHVCALRLRALYKKRDCTFCKEPQPTVIFTTSAEEPFASYKPESIPYKDAKLSISFETQDMMEETLLLLRFNCPDSDCPYIGNGWGDLKLHVRATHGKLMCFQNYDSLVYHSSSILGSIVAQSFIRKLTSTEHTIRVPNRSALLGHMVEEHGGDMSARDRKDARRIQAEFEFEEVGRHGRRDRGSHRDREPPARQTQQEPAPPPTPAVLRPPGPGRRREGFGANLTGEGASSNTSPGHSRPASPPRGDVDPALLDLENTASIINAFVDLLDSEEKKLDLLASWKGFEVEQRQQFPDLIPTAIAAPGTAGYASIMTGRVLNAKHATATRSSQRSSRQVWDRVAQAATQAGTSRPVDRFPALPGAGPSHTPAHRQPQRSTAWSASAGGSSGSNNSRQNPTPAQASSSHITVVPDPRSSRQPTGGPQAPPPKLSNALFPELPSAAPAKPKPPVKGNVSLQNILGNPTAPSVSAWGGGAAPGPAEGGSSEQATAGKGKKGKGKQKQTLFTLGSFPT